MSGELPPRRFVKLLRGAPLHRKFQRLGRVLEVSRFEAFGVTAALWDWTDENRPDGDLDGLDAEGLADSIAASDRFDPVKLVAAWLEVGLLDRDETGRLRVHGWTDEGRSGASHEARVEKARHASHVRWHVKTGRPNPEECAECRVEAKGSMPKQAPLSVPEQASPPLPDTDRDEDGDGDGRPEESLKRRTTRRNENAVTVPREYADDDPERPFATEDEATNDGVSHA
jgi:hypothetical protein